MAIDFFNWLDSLQIYIDYIDVHQCFNSYHV